MGRCTPRAVALCLRPRPAPRRALEFVLSAALLSGSLARLGLAAVPLVAGGGVDGAALLVVAASAFAGALGYGALLRWLLRYPLGLARLVTIAFGCTFAACAALALARRFPTGGSTWLAILWWLAFSGGLSVVAGRRSRPRPAPPPRRSNECLKMPGGHSCLGGTREQRRTSRRRMHLSLRALPHVGAADDRALLPLSLVPARVGRGICLNAMIEADRVALLEGEVEVVVTPSASGKGQRISRCPRCRVALWSNYAGAGDAIHFVRVGTLDEPDRLSPDVHIFTASKQPWVLLAPHIPAVPEYYKASEIWSAASLERRERVRARREQTQ